MGLWHLNISAALFRPVRKKKQYETEVSHRNSYHVKWAGFFSVFVWPLVHCAWNINRELKQPRRRRQQEPHKFAYLTMKNSILARFARAFFIFWHFEDVLVLSTTWNDLFCRWADDVSIWWQMFNFVFLCPKRWFQINSRIVRTHFFKHDDFE